MPKPVRELSKEEDVLPEPDNKTYLVVFSEHFVDAGARAMYRAWQTTDVELSRSWEEADPDLKATFRRQFRTGLAGVIRDEAQPLAEFLY
jgi:hypothetical protein